MCVGVPTCVSAPVGLRGVEGFTAGLRSSPFLWVSSLPLNPALSWVLATQKGSDPIPDLKGAPGPD